MELLDLDKLFDPNRPGRARTTPTPPADRWNAAEATRLQHEADTLVGTLGVNGLHPEVQAATARLYDAHRMRDMPLLRRRIAEFTQTVRRLAAAAPDLPDPDELPTRWRDLWIERVAIMEHDGGLPCEQAEHLALLDIVKLMHTEDRNT